MRDWSKLIAELSAANLTQEQIGTHCGAKQSTISDLKNGKTSMPSYDVGRKLVELHAQVMATKAAA